MRPERDAMFRQFMLAVLLIAIVGFALFNRVSGLAYIALVFSAALLSVLLVRRADAEAEDVDEPRRNGSVRKFPTTSPASSGRTAPSFEVRPAQSHR
jgi:hypothetical protein